MIGVPRNFHIYFSVSRLKKFGKHWYKAKHLKKKRFRNCRKLTENLHGFEPLLNGKHSKINEDLMNELCDFYFVNRDWKI